VRRVLRDKFALGLFDNPYVAEDPITLESLATEGKDLSERIADGRYPFTTGLAWGVATIAGDDVTLDVRGGRLDLASLSLRGRPLPVDRAAASKVR